MQIKQPQLVQLIEASLFVQQKPVTIKMLKETVLAPFQVTQARIKEALIEIEHLYAERGVELVQVAGGYRFQTRAELSPYLQCLWQEKAPKYSRATLETLAVIAYRQPTTRGDIEQVRGVAVGSHIIKTLLDRRWVRIVGHKEVPGRPALFATTPEFLSYFGLASLSDLPELTDPESLSALFSLQTKPSEEPVPQQLEESTNE